MTIQKVICLKYNDTDPDVEWMTDGKRLSKGDLVTFISPQGPIRIRMSPENAFDPPTWKTGDPPIYVLTTVKDNAGQVWCGGVEDGEQWGMKGFDPPEYLLEELHKHPDDPSLYERISRILDDSTGPKASPNSKPPDMPMYKATLSRLDLEVAKNPTKGHQPINP